MFCVELVAGWLGGSTAILGDALDMFGDAAVYGYAELSSGAAREEAGA
jgi:Co/Zn/Cd efflux system component